MNSYYILGTADKESDWNLVEVTEVTYHKMNKESNISLCDIIQIHQNNFGLKINISTDRKINIKIMDNNLPVYLRQFNPSSNEKEQTINTSGWLRGHYSITISDAVGANFAIGEFDIR